MPRHKEKFAALNVKRQVRLRHEALDMDYLSQLNDKEKAWLNSFLEETVITNFQHKGKKHYKSKKKKREFYSDNNARNRCMYTKAKAGGLIDQTYSEKALAAIIDGNNSGADLATIEDALIAYIDSKKDGLEDA